MRNREEALKLGKIAGINVMRIMNITLVIIVNIGRALTSSSR